jgi:hypothetical protein
MQSFATSNFKTKYGFSSFIMVHSDKYYGGCFQMNNDFGANAGFLPLLSVTISSLLGFYKNSYQRLSFTGTTTTSLPPYYTIDHLMYPDSGDYAFGIGLPRNADFSLYKIDKAQGQVLLYRLNHG